MTKDELFKLIDEKVEGLRNKAIIKDAVEDLLSESNNAKLPVKCWLELELHKPKVGQLTAFNSKSLPHAWCCIYVDGLYEYKVSDIVWYPLPDSI